MSGARVSRPGTGGWAALVALCLLLAVPMPAQARNLYINVELSQADLSVQPTGSVRQSTATVSAYYRTTTQALSSGDGTLQLTPGATLGRFTASEVNPLLAASPDCTWRGVPAGGHGLAELQDGTPFAHALSIQWPDYPGMWHQTLNAASTGKCRPAFTDVPLQGAVMWALGSAHGTGGGNHFLFAGAGRNAAVQTGSASASVADMTMTSLLARPGAAGEAVTAQGFMVESTVPFTGRRNVLPAPSISITGTLAGPLGAGALRALASRLVPRRIPRGCVAGQRRRRHQHCP